MKENEGANEGSEQIEEGEGQPDPLVGIKSEFSRKFENQNAKFNDLNAKLENILQTVQQSVQKPNVPQASMRDIMHDDPDAYAAIVEERAAARAEKKVSEHVRMSQATQAAALDISSKYAEFSQEGSEAYTLAIKKASELPAHLKNTPEGVKMAMLEAVSDLGLVPTSRKQRQQQSGDDFAVSGQSSGRSGTTRRQDPTKGVDPMTLEFAKLLNPKIADDPKRLEGLKKASDRKRWNQYE